MKKINRSCLWVLALSLLPLVSGCQLISQLKARSELNQGVRAYTAQRYEEATASFKEAIELDPELIDAYLYLATTYRVQFIPGGRSEENQQKAQLAVQTFQQVLEMDPDNATAMANIADLYNNMGDPDQSKEWYRKLIEVQEDVSGPLYGIAVIDYHLANEITGEKGIKVESSSEEQRAQARQYVDEGIEALKQALEARPDYVDAMQYLNLLYRERAELAETDDERRQWEREADKLALEALEMQRRQQAEAERQRRQVFGGEQGASPR